MYGCYRKEDAASAKTMLDAAAVVLANYPDAVMQTVTHPVTGLPSRLKWPPNIAEIREACEIAMAPVRAREEADERARKAREQLAERDRISEYHAAQPRVDLRAKYGPNYGLSGKLPLVDPIKDPERMAKEKADHNRLFHGEVGPGYVSPALQKLLAETREGE